jgi:ABC-type polysaccharide transport system permease subunit
MNNNTLLVLTEFVLFIATIIFAQVLGVSSSKKWFLIALIPGFIAGFILGMTTQGILSKNRGKFPKFVLSRKMPWIQTSEIFCPKILR